MKWAHRIGRGWPVISSVRIHAIILHIAYSMRIHFVLIYTVTTDAVKSGCIHSATFVLYHPSIAVCLIWYTRYLLRLLHLWSIFCVENFSSRLSPKFVCESVFFIVFSSEMLFKEIKFDQWKGDHSLEKSICCKYCSTNYYFNSINKSWMNKM